MPPTSVLPGITHLLNLYPESGNSLRQLAHQLLYQPSPLTRLEREIIAARTSMFNNCEFCHSSHKAIAIALAITEGTRDEGELAANEAQEQCTVPSLLPYGDRLFHLDTICRYTWSNGDQFKGAISDALIGKILTPTEVHDCVLITAAFCMYNRYVDSLNPTIATPLQYQESAARISERGYLK